MCGRFCYWFSHWNFCYMFQVLLLSSFAFSYVTGSAVVFSLKFSFICCKFCCFHLLHFLSMSQVLLFASAHTQCWHTAQSDRSKQKKWWNGCRTKNGASWFLMVRLCFWLFGWTCLHHIDSNFCKIFIGRLWRRKKDSFSTFSSSPSVFDLIVNF